MRRYPPAGARAVRRGRLLALTILALSFAASTCALPDPNRNCSTDGDEARREGAVVRAVILRLLWDSAPARAAAGLLRAALLGAGHKADDVTLDRINRTLDLCAKDDVSPGIARDGKTVVELAVAVPWSQHCVWSGNRLEVLGFGAAPVSPRLHKLLARGARTEDTVENATVYVLEGEWKKETEKLCAPPHGAGRQRCQPLARDGLARRIATGNCSFLFLDAELWRTESGVTPLATRAGDPLTPISLLVADRNALIEHAPAIYMLLKKSFAPHASDLRAVLAAAAADNLTVEDAACRHAPEAAGYDEWRNKASATTQRLAFVIVCDTETHDYYETAVNISMFYLVNTTKLIAWKAMFKPKVIFVDCSDSSALAVLIGKWKDDGRLWRTIGVVAPAEQASTAVLNANITELPLIAYTPVPAAAGVRSSTGSPAQLALALRRLLTVCGWRRLGLVSENTPLAHELKATLLSDEGLTTFEVSAENPAEAVNILRGNNTRVFFVNTDAAGAARVLRAAAAEYALAPVDGDQHVWIVRDYELSDNATAALRPLSVSFQWRGPEPRAPLLAMRTLGWKDHVWPRHAAALMDALFTLEQGFVRQLIADHKESLDYPHVEKNLRKFWKGVEEEEIAGVVSNLNYKERGSPEAPVYVERWETGTPQRFAWPPPSGECPVSPPPPDGSSRCLAPTGDRYNPDCLDSAWISASVAIAAMLAALTFVTVATRRWMVRRDRRRERAITARILAQREATFAELAPYLVDSDALQLGEELGAGRFGHVRRGEVRVPRRRPATVAVKALRSGASPAEESQFLREARLLAALDHDHVVRFEGVCWEGGPPLLLMELALFGDLLRYLRARRHLAEGAAADGATGEDVVGPEEAAAVSAEALTRMAREAAEALAYLADRGLVHRDVRAANCLVDARRSLKLADFGLARETGAADGEYACRGRALFPVLWMAPESLARGVATAASDAWSFGVLALELVTLGARPFGGAAPEAAVRAVIGGGRPPLPRDACAETRALALACWRRDPASRPPAARLAAWLARRRTALRPALAPDLEEPDCDSGIGEPDPLPLPIGYSDPAPDSRLSVSLVTLAA